jgi:uncharacterized protein (DUF2141 family)
MPVPTGVASAPPQAVYDQAVTPPASQSLINALETEFATPAVDELANVPSIPPAQPAPASYADKPQTSIPATSLTNEPGMPTQATLASLPTELPLADVPLAAQKTTAAREPLNGTTPPATAPAESAAVPAIRLVIAGVRPGYGDVKVAVFTDESAFPEPAGAVQTLSLPPSHTTLEQSLHLNSAFAVAVYQDINGDGELTRNRLGVPVEPFAFSNNAMGQRKPPSFEQAKVPLPNASALPLTLTINLP